MATGGGRGGGGGGGGGQLDHSTGSLSTSSLVECEGTAALWPPALQCGAEAENGVLAAFTSAVY